MLYPFFVQAAVSPTRQRSLRTAIVAHNLLLATLTGLVLAAPKSPGPLMALGQVLLIAGIVEGAVLIGWRLAQMPKTQALEFLLVSPVQPWRVYLAEALVGLARLAVVTLSGLPMLIFLVGHPDTDLMAHDLGPLVGMPLTWGAITGLGLTWWAYEPLLVRKSAELITIVGTAVYLLLGILIGENLPHWLKLLPPWVAGLIMDSFVFFHRYNPFAVMAEWIASPSWYNLETVAVVEAWALLAVALLTGRAAWRLKGHFRERHYKPIFNPEDEDRGVIGDRPLSWWAVKRVMEYSGRFNLYLAWAVGGMLAAYLVAGDRWPPFLGRQALDLILSGAGGVAGLTAGLVVLAGVPAAFQYGLWDSNAQDRCRRLELLLLTELGARDYWEAARAAAWKRGRGYFFVACLLWLAAAAAGQLPVPHLLAGAAAALALLALHFTVGFWSFSRGYQANGLGSLLTIGLPLAAYGLAQSPWPELTALTPPGAIYLGLAGGPGWAWALGTGLTAGLAWWLGHLSLRDGDAHLRQWYAAHHGHLAAE